MEQKTTTKYHSLIGVVVGVAVVATGNTSDPSHCRVKENHNNKWKKIRISQQLVKSTKNMVVVEVHWIKCSCIWV